MSADLAAQLALYDGDQILITAPELAQEASKRVVGGIIKACRAFVPTRDNAEGKKEHCNVALLNGALYLGTDHSVYAAVIRPVLEDLCKKKSPLRDAFIQLGTNYSATLNYGIISPWLKLHEANIRTATFSPSGIHLTVIPGVIELDMAVTVESNAYGQAVADMLDERILPENLIHGPHRLDSTVEVFDVLVVNDERAWYEPCLDLSQNWTQMKFKTGLLPKGDHDVSVYTDPHGGKIIRVTTDSVAMHVDQFFRILDLVDPL